MLINNTEPIDISTSVLQQTHINMNLPEDLCSNSMPIAYKSIWVLWCVLTPPWSVFYRDGWCRSG